MNNTVRTAFARWAYRLLPLSLAAHLLIIGLMSLTPPYSRDAIIHHLAIPKLYLEHGGMVELPQYFFSYYPQLLQLLYIIPVWLEADYLAKTIHFLFGLLTAGLIFGYLKRVLGGPWAYGGTLLFLTLPVVIKLSVTAYVDLGLIFFSFASLLALLKWLDKRDNRWFYLAGALCGLALSIKYNGLITLLILAAFVPFFYLRTLDEKVRQHHQWPAVKYGLLFVLVALLVFSPWMIRNSLWTGNPLHPFYEHLLSWQTEERAAEPDQYAPQKKHSHFWYRKHLYDETPLQTLTIPLRVFFQGQDNDPKWFDGRLNPVLLVFPLFLLLGTVPKAAARAVPILTLFSVLYIILVFLTTDMRARYIGPALAPLSLLSVLGLHALWRWLSARTGQGLASLAVVGLMLAALAPNLVYLEKLYREVDPLAYLSGRQSRDDYLTARLPTYAATHWINHNLSANSETLAIYLRQRPYYFEKTVDFNYRSFLTAFLRLDNEGMRVLAKKRGITHLLIRMNLFDQWVTDQSPEKSRQVVDFIRNHTRLLFDINGYGVFEIR